MINGFSSDTLSSSEVFPLLLRYSLFWGFPSSPEVFPLLLRYSSSPEVFPLLLRFSLFSWGFPSSPEVLPLLLRFSLFSWGFPSSPEVLPHSLSMLLLPTWGTHSPLRYYYPSPKGTPSTMPLLWLEFPCCTPPPPTPGWTLVL